MEVVDVDCCGLACPMPLIKLKKALSQHQGQMIRLIITDQGGLKDIPAFCKSVSLECSLVESDDTVVFEIVSK